VKSLRHLLQLALNQALGPAMRWKALLRFQPHPTEEPTPMSLDNEVVNASEALLAMPLPEMLGSLGRAVASANMELSKVPGPNGAVMSVTEATVDLAIAISMNTSSKVDVSGGLALKAFNVNASYARTFGFQETASSRISLKFAITPASK
jgi:hypothetical protein